MSSELNAIATRGATIHGQIRLGAKIFNFSTKLMEIFSSANYLDYVVPMTQQGDTRNYIADFPIEILAVATYQVTYWKQIGGSPVELTDVYQSSGEINWNGSSIIVPNDLANALITRTQAKEWLRINVSKEDDIIDQIILQQSEIIKQYCDRKFIQETFTQYYDGKGRGELFLRDYPIISVTTLNSDSSRAYAVEDNINISDDVLVDKSAGILQLWNNESAFASGHASVKVVYDAGYAVIPRDIQEACLLLVQHVYKRFYQDQKIGVSSESIGDRTTSFETSGIPSKVRVILDRYKKQGFSDSGYDL